MKSDETGEQTRQTKSPPNAEGVTMTVSPLREREAKIVPQASIDITTTSHNSAFTPTSRASTYLNSRTSALLPALGTLPSIFESLPMQSERPLVSTMTEEPQLTYLMYMMGMLWSDKTTWFWKGWYIILRLLTALYSIINWILAVYVSYSYGRSSSAYATLQDAIYHASVQCLFFSAGLLGLNTLISANQIYLRSKKKTPFYLLPFYVESVKQTSVFFYFTLIMNAIAIIIAFVVANQVPSYKYLILVAIGDIGTTCLLAGILLFILVDVKAADTLVQALEAADENLAIRHYDLVRREIKSREYDSRWINGLTTVVGIIQILAVVFFTVANQYHKDIKDPLPEHMLRAVLADVIAVKVIIVVGYIFLLSARVNERADKFIRRLSLSLCEAGAPVHLIIYASLRPIAFRLARYRVTKLRLALQVTFVLGSLIIGILRSL